MTRAELLAYLNNTMRRMAADAYVQNSDTPEGYTYILDDTFRALGVSEDAMGPSGGATVGDSLRADAQLIGQYFVLNAFLNNMAPNQDNDGTQIRSKRTQPNTQVQDRLNQITAQLKQRGYGVTLGLEQARTLRAYQTA